MVQPLIERPNHIQPAETEEQTLTVDDDNHVDFNVMSPPRPRGRPRQKPKAKKAKRNISIWMATEDSEMFEKQLNLSTIAGTLDVDADYSTMQILRCFKLYHFEKRQKPPTAYELCNIPPGKLLLAPKMLFRVLPIEILSRCQAKVTALQKKRKGLSKVNTAVEIHGVGVFAATTLSLMRNWHKAMESLRLVDKTEKWVKLIDFNVDIPPPIYYGRRRRASSSHPEASPAFFRYGTTVHCGERDIGRQIDTNHISKAVCTRSIDCCTRWHVVRFSTGRNNNNT
ncbi:hypothetical protein AM587_10000132 [Phytophthora nicotianae]|uniref:Uncharacterized protein n=1 Tax=Phytophthora nicotianae TaxID=4792 RepID=A0A0W8DVY0_PHYNI|nr:hypothetical protein AM587_10000132 [Phytophthora nicotianae]